MSVAQIDLGLLMPPDSLAVRLTQSGATILLDIVSPDGAPNVMRATLNRWAVAQMRETFTAFLTEQRPRKLGAPREHLTPTELAALRKAVEGFASLAAYFNQADNATVMNARIAVGIITAREEGK